MNFTARMDGGERATVKIRFDVSVRDLVIAAMRSVEKSGSITQLTKTGIERELRDGLWESGLMFSEFGGDRVEADWVHANRRQIEQRVKEIYGFTDTAVLDVVRM